MAEVFSQLAQPERTIKEALLKGFNYFADPEHIDLMERFFEGQEDEEIEMLKEFFSTWDEKQIIIGYPRSHTEFPVLAVVLRNENESETFLGDQIYKDNDTGEFWRGSNFAGTFGIGIYTANMDLTLALYKAAKLVLIVFRRFLEMNNVANATLSGSDVEPSPEYLPEYIYLRWLDVGCTYLCAARNLPEEIVGVGTFIPTVILGADTRNVTVERTPEGEEIVTPGVARFEMTEGPYE